MQFSFGKKNPVSSSAPADEKLQKAIERNKKKMAQRQARMASKSPAASSGSLASKLRQAGSTPDQMRKPSTSSSLLERMRANKSNANSSVQGPSASLAAKLRGGSHTPPDLPRQSSSATRELPKRQSMPSSSMSAGPARKPITSSDSIEMHAPVRRSSNEAAAVNYETKRITQSRSSTRKRKKKTFELASWFVKGAWLFCAFLIVRLIFSEGGVLEYQQTKSSYQNMQKELKELKVENDNLMIELEKMKNDSLYQKKLVRDHLGYIDKNEYLILFSSAN